MGKSKSIIFLSFFFISLSFFSQVVEEKIQIDTTTETIKVVYKPIEKSTYYYKKVAVFADDTTQVAVEKSYNKYGQNGLYQAYYPSGRLKIKTVFANDKINGEWTYYDPKGIIIIKGEYENGVKHGYWAYKSLRIYGRYKKGLKHRKWKRFDKSENKYLSHYKNGKLTGGEGHGDETSVILYEDDGDDDVKTENSIQISKEYEQAIAFLRDNVVFRKAYKKHFGQDNMKLIRELKTHFKRGEFRFLLAPAIINLDISGFVDDSNNGKIVVAAIDSVLKENGGQWKTVFNGQKVEDIDDLYDFSTFDSGEVSAYFSPVHNGLMRIDVIWFKEFTEDNFSFPRYQSTPQNQKFSVLLYFDSERVLKGAEYQKP